MNEALKIAFNNTMFYKFADSVFYEIVELRKKYNFLNAIESVRKEKNIETAKTQLGDKLQSVNITIEKYLEYLLSL